MKHALAFLLFPVLLSSQAAKEVEITAEPHHHEVFTNDQVRVFDVTIPQHEATLLHWHRHDYAIVFIGDSKVVNEVKGKPPVNLSFHDADVAFSPAPFVHVARNVADTPARNIDIEFLQDDQLRKLPAPKADDARGLQILQSGTQQILWIKDGIRASLYEIQPGGVIPSPEFAGPALIVALNDYVLRSTAHSKAPAAFSLQTGEVRWLPENFSQPMANASDGPARFIAFDFPVQAHRSGAKNRPQQESSRQDPQFMPTLGSPKQQQDR